MPGCRVGHQRIQTRERLSVTEACLERSEGPIAAPHQTLRARVFKQCLGSLLHQGLGTQPERCRQLDPGASAFDRAQQALKAGSRNAMLHIGSPKMVHNDLDACGFQCGQIRWQARTGVVQLNMPPKIGNMAQQALVVRRGQVWRNGHVEPLKAHAYYALGCHLLHLLQRAIR